MSIWQRKRAAHEPGNRTTGMKRIDASLISKRELARNNARLSEVATAAYDHAAAFKLQRDLARAQRWMALTVGVCVGMLAGWLAKGWW